MAYSRYLTMANKPRIRFKGFTEDWEQRKLGEFVKIISGDAPSTFISGSCIYVKVDDLNYSDRIQLSSSNLVNINPKAHLVNKGATIFPKRGAAIMTNKVRIMGKDGYLDTNMMALIPEEIDKDFLFTFIQKTGLYKIADTSTIPQINNKHIEPYMIQVPNDKEQECIGVVFEKIDKIITLHQCKLEKLKLTKKALLQKLFPKNGKHIPEIRFKGFTDTWEQREFSNIFTEVKSGLSRMLSNDDIGLPVVRANNINDGQLNLVDDIKYWYKNDPQGANTNNYLIEQGDILINFINSEAKMGTAAYVTRKPERDTIYTTNILRCKVNDEYNPYFIYSLTFLNSYKNYIASITKPAVNQASFTTVDFKKYSTKIPTVKEQNQIADLIETFNKFITLHQ